MEHLVFPEECGRWAGGPFSANSSVGDLGSGNSGLTEGDCVGCGDEGDTSLFGEENWLDEGDDEEPRGTRVCGNLMRLVEWLGRGRL